MSGAKIIKALKEAVAGDLARVTIEGQTWAKVKDIAADQQQIMHINNVLREGLLDLRQRAIDEGIHHFVKRIDALVKR